MISPALPRDAMLPELYRVTATRRELHDVVTLDLRPASGPLPHFRPGQFNMLYAFGIGEVAISLSGAVGNGPDFRHTLRAVGAVTSALARLEPGAALGLRGPFGSAWPVELALGRDVLLIAGGIGLAPLRPAILALLAARQHYGRINILAGFRGPADILFPEDLSAWRNRLDVNVEVTLDHGDAGWHGHVGVVPGLVARAEFDPNNAIAFVCGPEVMMRFTVNALRAAGLADAAMFLSMERNMRCAVGLCGHCQFGPHFICKDGPVLRCDRVAALLPVREF